MTTKQNTNHTAEQAPAEPEQALLETAKTLPDESLTAVTGAGNAIYGSYNPTVSILDDSSTKE